MSRPSAPSAAPAPPATPAPHTTRVLTTQAPYATTWVLVPAYQPGHRLIELVGALRRELPGVQVLVVDDGSGPDYRRIVELAARRGAHVLHHDVNRGKAAALRTGMAWLQQRASKTALDTAPDTAPATAPVTAIVCADADGQHRPGDVRRVVDDLARRAPDGGAPVLVLGSRAFVGRVPLRSRLGNRVSSALVALATGRRLGDTQTGLRAFPPGLLPWLLRVPGERFAYELRVLLEAARQGVGVVEVPIETVYLDRNTSSHFRPVVDSVRVMAPLLLFAASSVLAWGVDVTGVLVLHALTGSLALAVVVARLVSAAVNFVVNRRAVFASRGHPGTQLIRYAALAVVLLVVGYLAMVALTHIGLPLVVAKLGTDLGLWLASYAVQRRLVFAPEPQRSSGSSASSTSWYRRVWTRSTSGMSSNSSGSSEADSITSVPVRSIRSTRL